MLQFTAVQAQCPQADFNLPRTTYCVGDTLNLTNSSQNFLDIEWLFCDKHFRSSSPVVVDTIPAFDANFNSQAIRRIEGMAVGQEAGNYNLFMLGGRNLMYRADFGGNLNVNPITNPLGNPQNALNQPSDLILQQVGTGWVMFISNAGNNTLLRIQLPFLTAGINQWTFTNLGNPGGALFNPRGLQLLEDSTGQYLLVSNANGRVVQYQFGTNGFQDTTLSLVQTIDLGATAGVLWGMDTVRRCTTLSTLVYDLTNASFYRLDFERGLDTLPSIVSYTSTDPNNTFANSRHPEHFYYQGRHYLVGFTDQDFFLADLGQLTGATYTPTRLPLPQLPRSSLYNYGTFYQYQDGGAFRFLTILSTERPDEFYRVSFPGSCMLPLETSDLNTHSFVLTQPDTLTLSLSAYSEFNKQGLRDQVGRQILIDDVPTVDFTPENVCAGQSLDVSASIQLDQGVLQTVSWDFGGQATLLGNTATYRFTAPGTYPITLEAVTQNTGCFDSLVKNVEIHPVPQVDFASLNPCSRDSFVWTNNTQLASGQIAAYQWRLGNGDTLTAATPRYAFPDSGQVPVQLWAQSDSGCVDSTSRTIPVRLKPRAGFVADETCLGQPTFFQNTTVPPAAADPGRTRFWDLDDSLTTTVGQPQHTFSDTGVYTVRLQLTSGNGCGDTLVQQVGVGFPPSPEITAPDTGCQFAALPFSGDSSTTVSGRPVYRFVWSYGDGSPLDTGANVTHTYTQPGVYTVIMQAIGFTDCDSFAQKTLVIKPAAKPEASATGFCDSLPTNFIDLSTPPAGVTITGRLWDLPNFLSGGDDTNATFQRQFDTLGVFPYTLQVFTANGCTTRVADSFALTRHPVSAFGVLEDSVLVGDTLMFQDSSTSLDTPVVAWDWSFGSQAPSPQLVANTPGPLPVSLRVRNAVGCRSALARDTLWVGGVTLQRSSTDTVCSGPYNGVTGLAAGVSNLQWDYCEGDLQQGPLQMDIDTVQPPSLNRHESLDLVQYNGQWYAFVEQRDHVFRLNIGADLESPTVTTTPVIQEGLMNGARFIELFELRSGWLGVVSDVRSEIFLLDFGASPLNTPTFSVFPNPDNVRQSRVFSVQVLEEPDSTYLVVGLEEKLVVYTLGDSAGPTIRSYRVFNLPGQNTGRQLVGLQPIRRGPRQWSLWGALWKQPTFYRFDFNSGLSGAAQVQVFNQLQSFGAGFWEHELVRDKGRWYYLGFWGFGRRLYRQDLGPDGLAPVGPAADWPINLPTTPSRYQESFAIGKDSSTWVACMFGTAIAGGINLAELYRYRFPDTCVVDTPWKSGANASFPDLARPGQLFYSFSAQDSLGQTTYISDSLFVVEQPRAAFESTPLCSQSGADFFDRSVLNVGSISSWDWRFTLNGVTNSTGAQNPSNVFFPDTGAVPLQFVVSSSFCSDTLDTTLQINQSPRAAFTPQTGCANDSVRFVNFSDLRGQPLSAFTWDLDDGSILTRTDASPFSYLYGLGDTFQVQLVAETQSGCTDTNVQSVWVPRINFDASSLCLGDTVLFTPDLAYPGTVTQYAWDFGDGTALQGPQPQHQYQAPGVYTVTLAVATSNGCRDTLQKQLEVLQKPELQLEVSGQPCPGRTVFFEDQTQAQLGNPISQRFWDFGDPAAGGADTLRGGSGAYTYADTGLYTVSFQLTTESGCVADTSFSLPVQAAPQADFQVQDSLCTGQLAPIQNTSQSSQPPLDFRYELGDGRFALLENPAIRYDTLGQQVITLFVEDASGCRDTTRDTVQVLDKLRALMFPLDTLAGRVPLTVRWNSSAPNSTERFWLLETVQVGADSQLTLTFDSVGTYEVRLVATNGFCTDTAANFVSVAPPFVPSYDYSLDSISYIRRDGFVYLQGVVNNRSNADLLTMTFEGRVGAEARVTDVWTGNAPAQQTTLVTLQAGLAYTNPRSPEFICLHLLTANDTLDRDTTDQFLCRTYGDRFFSLPPYPNPTEGPITVEVDLPAPDVLFVELLDAFGRRVYRSPGQRLEQGPHTLTYNFAPQASGVYTLRFRFRNTQQDHPLLILAP